MVKSDDTGDVTRLRSIAWHHLQRFGPASFLRIAAYRTTRPLVRAVQRLRFAIHTLPLRVLPRPADRSSARHGGDYLFALTSFPARIKYVWATIVTLLRQTVPPSRVVLVLAIDEFPDRRLPRRLRALESSGLTIMWIERTLRSYNKFIPVRTVYPNAQILTVDDDILYLPDVAERLLAASEKHPGTIIGHRGWLPRRSDGANLAPYRTWMRHHADPSSPNDQVFLTGVGGVLYPPIPAFDALATNSGLAVRLAPTADDVWFWASAKATNTARFCTGGRFGAPNGLEASSPSLSAENVFGRRNDSAIAAVVQYLRLALGPSSNDVPPLG